MSTVKYEIGCLYLENICKIYCLHDYSINV